MTKTICKKLAITFIFVSIATLFSCKNDYPENKNDLLLAIDFESDAESALCDSPSGQLVFCPGVDGQGLNLQECPSLSTKQNSDTTWFSSAKDFTVSLWIKASTSSADTTIILSNSDFRTQDAGIYGKRNTNKGFTLYSMNGGWGWNVGNGRLHYLYEPIAENQPIADNDWHLLAFSHNAAEKEVRLYYDGINKAVLKIGDLAGRDIMSSLPLQLGSWGDNSSTYTSFQGQVDKLRVWGTVLSGENIKNEYKRFFKTKKEPALKTDTITVVNWNIWHGGTHFTLEKDGFDGIDRTTELIRNAGADIVLMQETYGAGSRISSNLGFYYYEASSTIGAVWGANLSVMSRFPMEDAYMIEQRSNYGKNYAFNNGGVKIRLSGTKSVIAFSNWYNGRKPEDLEGALNGWSDLLENADNVPIIWGGDFNSVSHLDDGIGKSGHSKLMTSAGFMDSYRIYFPDAKKHPGFSGPSFYDRIDYIYYKGAKMELIEAAPIIDNFKGKNNTPSYPSDHLGFVAKFKVN